MCSYFSYNTKCGTNETSYYKSFTYNGKRVIIISGVRDRLNLSYRAPTPFPPICVAKKGENHLNEEITPLLPTGIGERYSPTISNLGHAALLRRLNSPYKRERWTNLEDPLVNSLLWDISGQILYQIMCEIRNSIHPYAYYTMYE